MSRRHVSSTLLKGEVSNVEVWVETDAAHCTTCRCVSDVFYVSERVLDDRDGSIVIRRRGTFLAEPGADGVALMQLALASLQEVGS